MWPRTKAAPSELGVDGNLIRSGAGDFHARNGPEETAIVRPIEKSARFRRLRLSTTVFALERTCATCVRFVYMRYLAADRRGNGRLFEAPSDPARSRVPCSFILMK